MFMLINWTLFLKNFSTMMLTIAVVMALVFLIVFAMEGPVNKTRKAKILWVILCLFWVICLVAGAALALTFATS